MTLEELNACGIRVMVPCFACKYPSWVKMHRDCRIAIEQRLEDAWEDDVELNKVPKVNTSGLK